MPILAQAKLFLFGNDSCRDSRPRLSIERSSIFARNAKPRLRYTFKTVTRICSILLLSASLSISAFADETSFHRIQAPNAKGKPIKAVLTFSDNNKAIQIQPARGHGLSIPYDAIDKFSYEYTKKHRVTDETIATAPLGIGAVAMLTKSRSHWLQIDYREQNVPREYVLRMDKHEYLQILDAIKAHTGKDAEVLGNADKRRSRKF